MLPLAAARRWRRGVFDQGVVSPDPSGDAGRPRDLAALRLRLDSLAVLPPSVSRQDLTVRAGPYLTLPPRFPRHRAEAELRQFLPRNGGTKPCPPWWHAQHRPIPDRVLVFTAVTLATPPAEVETIEQQPKRVSNALPQQSNHRLRLRSVAWRHAHRTTSLGLLPPTRPVCAGWTTT